MGDDVVTSVGAEGTGDVIERVEGDTYYAHHDMRRDGLCVTIALALEAATGREAGELVSSFADYVDPDALDRLFRERLNGAPRRRGRLHLPVAGHRITVHGDGTVEVRLGDADR